MKIYDEYVIRLMEAYLTGKLDDAGRKELEAWCGACEKNRKFFERVCREDRIAREVPLYAEVDGEKAFRHFQKRIRGRKWLRRLVRCAAVLLLPLGVVAVWQWMGMEVHRDTGQEIVPGTSRAVLTLAGGEAGVFAGRKACGETFGSHGGGTKGGGAVLSDCEACSGECGSGGL